MLFSCLASAPLYTEPQFLHPCGQPESSGRVSAPLLVATWMLPSSGKGTPGSMSLPLLVFHVLLCCWYFVHVNARNRSQNSPCARQMQYWGSTFWTPHLVIFDAFDSHAYHPGLNDLTTHPLLPCTTHPPIMPSTRSLQWQQPFQISHL